MNKSCNLYYCKCVDAEYNVGDIFGPFLLNQIVDDNYKVNIIDRSLLHDPLTPSLMIVGSIASDSQKGCVICGCGILLKIFIIPDFLDCTLVRGKYTLSKIRECKPAYQKDIMLGDPGLVLPYFIDKKITTKKYKYGIVPHYVDKHLLHKFPKNNEVTFIDINNENILDFSNKLMECESIISSSLHGLIFANSLCIPTAWIRIKETLLTSDDIKFYDYFSVYEEYGVVPICNLVEKQLSMNDLSNLNFYSIDRPIMIELAAKIMYRLVQTIKQYVPVKDKYDLVYDDNIGSKLINQQIQSPNKFIISRIGGLELDLYLQYKSEGANSVLHSEIYAYMKKYAGYYDDQNNSDNIVKYCQLFEKCYDNSQITMIANAGLSSYTKIITILNLYYMNHHPDPQAQSTIQNLLKNKMIVNYHIQESFYYLNDWFKALDRKKILIVSTFDEEIKDQLKIKDELFPKNFLEQYPDFESVDYVHTYLTLDNYENPHHNWFETYNYYCQQIDSKDFDIALLFCGCYAYPIANYIYEKMNKSSIIVGGIGQLLFGIRGSRWETPYFQRLMNDKWTKRILNQSVNGIRSEGLNAYFF